MSWGRALRLPLLTVVNMFVACADEPANMRSWAGLRARALACIEGSHAACGGSMHSAAGRESAAIGCGPLPEPCADKSSSAAARLAEARGELGEAAAVSGRDTTAATMTTSNRDVVRVT